MAELIDLAKMALVAAYPGVMVRVVASDVSGESVAARFSDDGSVWVELELDRDSVSAIATLLPKPWLRRLLDDARAGDW